MQTFARRPRARNAAAALGLMLAAACSPVFNWREARLDGSGVAMLFPCRPAEEHRTVRIGSAPVPMHLHSCRAGGANFLLAYVDAGEPAAVTPLLTAFRSQAALNLAGVGSEERPFAAAGATPNPQSVRLEIVGARADGKRVVAQAAFFVKGLRLYEAAVLDPDGAGGREAVDTFFGAIRLS